MNKKYRLDLWKNMLTIAGAPPTGRSCLGQDADLATQDRRLRQRWRVAPNDLLFDRLSDDSETLVHAMQASSIESALSTAQEPCRARKKKVSKRNSDGLSQIEDCLVHLPRDATLFLQEDRLSQATGTTGAKLEVTVIMIAEAYDCDIQRVAIHSSTPRQGFAFTRYGAAAEEETEPRIN